MSNKTRDSFEIPFFSFSFFFWKGPENKWSDKGKKKKHFNGCFTLHIFQRKENIHVFHEIDIRAQWFGCYCTLQGVTREWFPSPKQRGLKSSLKYLPLVPRGSRETRECFSALILKVRVHWGKNSSNYGGIVLLLFFFFFETTPLWKMCPSSKAHDIRGENHRLLPDTHKNGIFTHRIVKVQQLVDGSYKLCS